MTTEAATTAQTPGRGRGGALAQVARDVAARLELAWNRNSGEGVAALFGERADYIPHSGGLLSGRDAIRQALETAFAGGWARSRSEFRLLKVKPLADNVVVAMLGQTLTLLDQEEPRELAIRTTALLRNGGAEWKIVMLQGTAVARRTATGTDGGDAPDKAPRKTARQS